MKRSVFLGALLLTGAAQAMPYGPGPSYGYSYPALQGDPACAKPGADRPARNGGPGRARSFSYRFLA